MEPRFTWALKEDNASPIAIACTCFSEEGPPFWDFGLPFFVLCPYWPGLGLLKKGTCLFRAGWREEKKAPKAPV